MAAAKTTAADATPAGKKWLASERSPRPRYRHSRTRPSPLTPGAVERYSVNLWATSLVFNRGHRIGVVISSSNFPNYDRHPNAHADLSKTTEIDFVAATRSTQESGYRDQRYFYLHFSAYLHSTMADQPPLDTRRHQFLGKAIDLPANLTEAQLDGRAVNRCSCWVATTISNLRRTRCSPSPSSWSASTHDRTT